MIYEGRERVRLFHVETKRADGSWKSFTENPLEGEEAAKVHLDEVQRHLRANGLDPECARLHELTEEERLQETVATLTREERDDIVADHIRRTGIDVFYKHLAAARVWKEAKLEKLRQELKADPTT
jgi:hypothetical protein